MGIIQKIREKRDSYITNLIEELKVKNNEDFIGYLIRTGKTINKLKAQGILVLSALQMYKAQTKTKNTDS